MSTGLVAAVLPQNEGFGPDGAGAIGLVVRRLALADKRYTSVVLGSAQTASVFADVAFRAVTNPPYVPRLRGLAYRVAVARAINDCGADLIEVHNRPLLALYLARRFPHLPVSLFLHNDPQHMRGAAHAWQRGRMLRRLASVVAVSDYVRDRMVHNVTTTDVQLPIVVANGLDIGALPRGDSREKLILFAGRLVAEKGADSFIAACALALPRLPGWQAEIIGARRLKRNEIETNYSRSLRRQAEIASVRLTGYQPHHAVLVRMAQAALVLVPSRWPEPFGLTALEAMGCGAALIASPRGNLAALAGDGAVLIDPDDHQAMADSIVALAQDPARRQALADRGRLRAAAFDMSVVAKALTYARTTARQRKKG